MDKDGYIALVYSLSCALMLGFVSFAFIYAKHSNKRMQLNQESFITARRQVGAACRPGCWGVAGFAFSADCSCSACLERQP